MYKAAVIGLGNIGAQFKAPAGDKHSLNHADTYQLHNKVKLIGGVDTSTENRALFTKTYYAKSYESIEELLTAEKPDIISICSPTNLHAKHLHQILDAGIKMVWLEKPVSDSLADLDDLQKKAMANNASVLVNFQRRYCQHFAQFKHLFESQKLGKPAHMQITYSKTLETNGCHMLDSAFFITGDKAGKLDCIINADKINPSFQFHIGALPVTVTGIDVDYHCLDIGITFEQGRVTIGQNSMQCVSEHKAEHEYFPGFYRLKQDEKPLLPPENMLESFYSALDDLITSFESKSQPQSNLSTARLSEELIEQVKQRTGDK